VRKILGRELLIYQPILLMLLTEPGGRYWKQTRFRREQQQL